uniref:Uncharacterized protein n=1 Tax=Plectus sambesii TaxID=2011161 RepID=A0A914VXV0_9BILA
MPAHCRRPPLRAATARNQSVADDGTGPARPSSINEVNVGGVSCAARATDPSSSTPKVTCVVMRASMHARTLILPRKLLIVACKPLPPPPQTRTPPQLNSPERAPIAHPTPTHSSYHPSNADRARAHHSVATHYCPLVPASK